jgi:uncharacterized protein YndB with AHSA1/START domain
MSNDNSTQTTEKRDIVVTRVFDTPVEQVWKAWSDPEYVMQWWGPEGFTSPLAKIDFREGGTSLVCMRSPEGQDLYNTWTYRKIVPMQRIEFIQNFSDEDGKTVDPVKMGMPTDFPRDVRNVVTFKAVGDNKTEMTVTEYGYTSDQMFDLSRAGLEQCLDKMAASLRTVINNEEASMAQNDNTEPMQMPTSDPALKRLDKLVGSWTMKGRTLDSEGDNISGRTTFEWLPGGFFLQQRFEMNFAGIEIQSLELIGYNPETKAFSSLVYSNLWGAPLPYQWDLQDDVLKISTEASKFEGRFSEDGNTFSGGWRPIPGMEGPGNVPYDISGARVK